MVSNLTWMRYVICRLQHCSALGYKNYLEGHVKDKDHGNYLLKHFSYGTLTFLHRSKRGEEMAPTIAGKGATLLVRQLPIPDPTKSHSSNFLEKLISPTPEFHRQRRVFVGDVVVLKNPETPDNYLVRRLAAIEGYEMASTDEKEEPFILEEDHCWVAADNEKLKAKEAIDSRTFGPVPMTSIVGRVLYWLQSAADHGRVQNSLLSMRKDSPVLEAELDIDEMVKSHKANFNSEEDH